MSQVHAAPGAQGVAAARTVFSGACDSLIWIPARAKSATSRCISTVAVGVPLTYWSLKDATWPCLMPAPHSPAPVPGLEQVLTPPGLTLQPSRCSSATAAVGL